MLILNEKGLKWATDVNGTIDILWSDVMNEIWCAIQNNRMQNMNRELILFNGLFGSCFDCIMNQECMDFHYNRMKETLNKECKVTRLTNEVLPHHSKDMPLYSFDTLNGKLAFPIPGNLGANDFRHCPEMVVRDVIRMWSEVNESLPGISLTMPMFADGYVNLNPGLIGPKFSQFDQPFSLTRLRDDWLNRCYSRFFYVPDRFKNLSQVNQWTLSTDVDCLNYYVTQETAKGEEKTSTNYLRAHCILLSDRYKPMCSSDGLFAKVPCSIVAHHYHKKHNTLILFSNLFSFLFLKS